MIPIVFSTDHNYVMPTGVTILSLLLSNKDQIFDIFILCGSDVNEDDKTKLSHQVLSVSNSSKINFINIGNEFANGYEIRDISSACYYRLLIPWLIPQYDKVIYSDVDIIFKSSIKDFYDQNLVEYVAGVNTPGFTSSRRTIKYITKLGIDPFKYINSGFILINSKRQRIENLKPKYMELSKEKFIYQDQDIINIVANGSISLQQNAYNISPRQIGSDGRIKSEEVVVLHYAGDKPWKTFTMRWLDWWDVYNMSIFYEDDFYDKISSNILNRKVWITNQLKKFKDKYLQF